MVLQLAFLQRERAGSTGLALVQVMDPHLPRQVRHALAEEGYQWDGHRWMCHVETGVTTSADAELGWLDGGMSEVAAVAKAEHERWPLKIVGAGLPTFVVPIRPQWAEQLFDSNLAAGILFGRDAGLGLSREHVY